MLEYFFYNSISSIIITIIILFSLNPIKLL